MNKGIAFLIIFFSIFYDRWANEDIHARKIKGWLIFFLPFFALFGVTFLLHICSK
jgi:hypothetical protein